MRYGHKIGNLFIGIFYIHTLKSVFLFHMPIITKIPYWSVQGQNNIFDCNEVFVLLFEKQATKWFSNHRDFSLLSIANSRFEVNKYDNRNTFKSN